MKSIFLVLILIAFGAPSACGQSHNKSMSSLLTGKWSYKSGHYIYFDSSNRKLKQSEVTGIEDISVEVSNDWVRIIYPDQVYETSYGLTLEKGKRFITLNLGNGLTRYQVLFLNNRSVTLKSKHNISFYVDGDPDKKAAYSIFIINMVKERSVRR